VIVNAAVKDKSLAPLSGSSVRSLKLRPRAFPKDELARFAASTPACEAEFLA
jgi:hypothetical protein